MNAQRLNASTDTVVFHAWNEKGFQAPYTLVTILETPAPPRNGAYMDAWQRIHAESNAAAKALGVSLCSCYVCGMSLQANYVLRDATGKPFVVGCDCVEKIGDDQVITAVENAAKTRERNRRRELAARKVEERIAARKAELEAQRQKNGGLTDWEVEEAARLADRDSKRNAAIAANAWVLSWVPSGPSGSFVGDVSGRLASGELVAKEASPRMKAVMVEMFAKRAGRKGSKAYDAAEAEAREELAA